MLHDMTDWLSARPAWVRAALSMLLEHGSIDAAQVETLAQMCEAEVDGTLDKIQFRLTDHALLKTQTRQLRLHSIDSVTNVNALAPRRPLEIDTSETPANLTLIYGHNGAGKSGYVRLLKHLCGAKHQGSLHSDVFKSANDNTESSADNHQAAACELSYSIDGHKQNVTWTEDSGIIAQLSGIDIFDTSCGQAYLQKSDEISHEPRLLQLFTALTEIGDQLSADFNARIQELHWEPKDPGLTISGSEIGQWYLNLSHTDDESMLDMLNGLDIEALKLSVKKMSVACNRNLGRVLDKHQAKTRYADVLKAFEKLQSQFGPANLAELQQLHQAVKQAENAAVAARELANSTASASAATGDQSSVNMLQNLSHITSEAWQNLWRAAAEFSQEYMYPQETFPNQKDGARCVLCRQEMTPEAQKRLRTFDEFLHSAATEKLRRAEAALEQLNTQFGAVLEESELELFKKLARLPDSDLRSQLYGAVSEYLAGLKLVYELIRMREFDGLPVRQGSEAAKRIAELIRMLRLRETETSADYESMTALFREEDPDDIARQLQEIDAQIWVHYQTEDIRSGLQKLRDRERLIQARKLCRTAELSRKKGELFDQEVLNQFVQRFNEELRLLRAEHLRVAMVRGGVSKGRVQWSLQLQDAALPVPLTEVLSEGEQRMLELAAFLADVRARKDSSTFIFDDPISSLDSAYEAAVVDRLLMLARERQVIVLTHRISLLSLINEFAGKYPDLNLHEIAIRREPWGAGEPGNVPLATRGTRRLFGPLFELLDKAEKIWREEGFESYRPHAQYLCTEIRILIERLVETDLLGDVVQRHRRAIITKDKLHHLTLIEAGDCLIIEQLMSRYSTFVHAQSYELPSDLPTPQQLRQDLKSLKDWRSALEKRRRAG